MRVREKTKCKLGRKKCSKSDIFPIWIITPLHFSPLKIWHLPKVDTQGIKNLFKKNVGPKENKLIIAI